MSEVFLSPTILRSAYISYSALLTEQKLVPGGISATGSKSSFSQPFNPFKTVHFACLLEYQPGARRYSPVYALARGDLRIRSGETRALLRVVRMADPR